MICPKCRGLVICEPTLDYYGRANPWRCLNCGASPQLVQKTWPSTQGQARVALSDTRNVYARSKAARLSGK